MSTLSNYRKEVKKMFIISVKRDLATWRENGDFYSPSYNNNSYFRIDRCDFFNILRVSGSQMYDERVCLINWLFIPFDIKVFFYYMKLKNHFRTIRNDKKVKKNIESMKTSLDDMKSVFIKEIRKEKLIQIEK